MRDSVDHEELRPTCVLLGCGGELACPADAQGTSRSCFAFERHLFGCIEPPT